MAALAPHRQADFVAGPADKAGLCIEYPRVIARIHVLSNDIVHLRIVKAALSHHQLSPAEGFLRRLKKPFHRPLPAVAVFAQPHGRAQGQRHVRVVSAGMHHARTPTGKVQSLRLLHGQCVHIGADGHASAFAVAQDAHHAVAVTEGMGFNAQGTQLPQDNRLGPLLLSSQLRMRMQRPAQFNHPGHNRLQLRLPLRKVHVKSLLSSSRLSSTVTTRSPCRYTRTGRRDRMVMHSLRLVSAQSAKSP